MLDFFYSQTYAIEDTFQALFDYNYPRYALTTHITLYALGDKYEIPHLSEYAAFRSGERCRKADVCGLLRCLPLVYTSTPETDRTLRDLVIEEMISRSTHITGSPETTKHILDLINEHEQIRQDLCLGLFAELYVSPLQCTNS